MPEDHDDDAVDKVQVPPLKQARSIPLKHSLPVDAGLTRRTRSQSRSGVGIGLPFFCPPPTIPESPVALGESSPLSEPEEVPEISMADIFQDHVLEA